MSNANRRLYFHAVLNAHTHAHTISMPIAKRYFVGKWSSELEVSSIQIVSNLFHGCVTHIFISIYMHKTYNVRFVNKNTHSVECSSLIPYTDRILSLLLLFFRDRLLRMLRIFVSSRNWVIVFHCSCHCSRWLMNAISSAFCCCTNQYICW